MNSKEKIDEDIQKVAPSHCVTSEKRICDACFDFIEDV